MVELAAGPEPVLDPAPLRPVVGVAMTPRPDEELWTPEWVEVWNVVGVIEDVLFCVAEGTRGNEDAERSVED